VNDSFAPIGSDDPLKIIRSALERARESNLISVLRAACEHFKEMTDRYPNRITMHPDIRARFQELRAANHRPTGKRAQRRAGKEWNR